MTRFNTSVFFTDVRGKAFFLVQVLNVGRETDELKLIFNHPDAGTGVVYTESPNSVGESDVIRFRAEVTYHSDGSVLQKMLGYGGRNSTIYKNPFGTGVRRTPLNQIQEWTPIIRYWVARYDLCKKPESSSMTWLPTNQTLFNGEPFGCLLYLGSASNLTPCAKYQAEIIHRLNSVANGIDMLIQIGRSSYRGHMIEVPGTTICGWSDPNIVEILEVKKPDDN